LNEEGFWKKNVEHKDWAYMLSTRSKESKFLYLFYLKATKLGIQATTKTATAIRILDQGRCHLSTPDEGNFLITILEGTFGVSYFLYTGCGGP